MRTIEFRGKRVDNGEWVYGYVDATMYKDIVVIHTETGTFGVNPETVGQFTGYYDKNGNGIYEGDIIAILDGDYVVRGSGKVEWLEEWGIWYVDGDGESNNGLGDLRYNYDFEVIGNIHDNPELMKGGEE